jgi:hypothetical protein
MSMTLDRFKTEPHKIYSSGWFVFCLVIIAALVLELLHQQTIILDQTKIDQELQTIINNEENIIAHQGQYDQIIKMLLSNQENIIKKLDDHNTGKSK